jgi:hypothetical protein
MGSSASPLALVQGSLEFPVESPERPQISPSGFEKPAFEVLMALADELLGYLPNLAQRPPLDGCNPKK